MAGEMFAAGQHPGIPQAAGHGAAIIRDGLHSLPIITAFRRAGKSIQHRRTVQVNTQCPQLTAHHTPNFVGVGGIARAGNDHGGVLRFNPSDPNVYSRFCTLQNQLQQLEQQVQAQSPTGTDAIQLLAQADQRAKGLLAGVFGPGNDFDAMLGGTNLLAVAGNGERVITNLFAALQPILEAGARQCADAKATLAVQQAQAARAARGVQV